LVLAILFRRNAFTAVQTQSGGGCHPPNTFSTCAATASAVASCHGLATNLDPMGSPPREVPQPQALLRIRGFDQRVEHPIDAPDLRQVC
jgi:hypothetical protein